MPQGTERLLEILYGLAVGRPLHGSLSSLPAVRQGLVPYLALGEVVCQLSIMLLQPILVQLFDSLPNGSVQGLASLHQETIVGDILDHGVLEDVSWFRQEPLLVADLQGLQLA